MFGTSPLWRQTARKGSHLPVLAPHSDCRGWDQVSWGGGGGNVCFVGGEIHQGVRVSLTKYAGLMRNGMSGGCNAPFVVGGSAAERTDAGVGGLIR